MEADMDKRNTTILFYWMPVLLWCALIFTLSSIPHLRSDFSDETDLILRKLAHMTEYALLVGLYFRAARRNLSVRRSLASAVLFAFTFALTDEYHQTFVVGRSGQPFDVFIDSLGIFLAVFLIDKWHSDATLKVR
jgi:VanZ family protein